MYSVKCENAGSSKDPLLTLVSEFAILFGNELDSEVFYLPFDLSLNHKLRFLNACLFSTGIINVDGFIYSPFFNNKGFTCF